MDKTSTRRAALGSLLLCLGCGAASSGGAARAPQGELDQYFIGTQTLRLPDGTEEPAGAVLTHRTLQPDEHVILEESIVRARDGSTEQHVLRLDVDESSGRFALRESGGELTGEGALSGDPWHWTAWHVQIRRPDGSLVVTDELLTATDLRVESRLVSEGDAPSPVIRQVLSRVSRERFEEERRRLEAEAAAE